MNESDFYSKIGTNFDQNREPNLQTTTACDEPHVAVLVVAGV